MSRVCQAHVESQPNDRWVVARRFGKDEILTQHLGLECSSDLHRESCYDKPNMCGSFINVASLTTRTDDDADDDDDDRPDRPDEPGPGCATRRRFVPTTGTYDAETIADGAARRRRSSRRWRPRRSPRWSTRSAR